jgi:hypothetical protein
VGEGETLEKLEDRRNDESWERDKPALDEGPLSGRGADAAGSVSELDHSGEIRSPGQLKETTCEDPLQPIPSSLIVQQKVEVRVHFFSCFLPSMLKEGT